MKKLLIIIVVLIVAISIGFILFGGDTKMIDKINESLGINPEIDSEVQLETLYEGLVIEKGELVSWYNFNEGFDDSISGDVGIPYDAARVLKKDGILELPGRNDYLDLGNKNKFNELKRYTISVWVKIDTWNNKNAGIVWKGNNDVVFGLGLEQIGSGGKNSNIVSYFVNNNKINSGNLLPSKWYHLVGSYENGEGKFYVNGDLIGSKKLSFNNFESNLYIGKSKDSYNLNKWFDGSLDNLMIFNKALGDDEIKIIYNEQKK